MLEIALVASPDQRIQALVFQVVSLAKAKDALRQAGLLGEVHEHSISFDTAKIGGLHIQLVE